MEKDDKTDLLKLEIKYLNSEVREICLRMTDMSKRLESINDNVSIRLLRYVRLLDGVTKEIKTEVIEKL